MTTQRRLAVSYSRFSDPKQAQGDSEDRQDRKFRQFCQLHNLTPLPEVYADKGLSGYHGTHRKKGKLKGLIARAEAGGFEKGTVIVVEAWDRLGRMLPDKQTDMVCKLVRTGVSIGVCSLGDIFTEADIGTHKWIILQVFIQMAYQESKQKGDRVAASWASRREKAREAGTPANVRLPAWLERVNGVVQLVPGRAVTLKKIFRLAAEGCGFKRIKDALEAGGDRPFGERVVRMGRSRGAFSGEWRVPYLTKLLNDRRAVGEYQFRTADGKPVGTPIQNYYPAAVTEQEFLLAQAGKESRAGKGCRGPRQVHYVNLFKGMLTHATDGEGFMLFNKGTAEAPQLILYTAAGRRGHRAVFDYATFETAVLTMLREVDPAQVLPREAGAVSRADGLRAKLAKVRQDIASINADLREGYSKHLAALLREREGEEEKVGQELQDELARTVRPAEQAWAEVPTLVNMVRDGGDEARLKLRVVLRQVVEHVYAVVVPCGAAQLAYVQVFFTGGKTREYLIYRRQAQGGFVGKKPAAWAVASWANKWGTSSPFHTLKDNPERAKKIVQAITRRAGEEPTPPEVWWTCYEVEHPNGQIEEVQVTPGQAELMELMRQAATPEGGRPDPEVAGMLISQTLGANTGLLSGRTPAVE
jgi:DNA invertase Pin-like site-specific DNA recombinase